RLPQPRRPRAGGNRRGGRGLSELPWPVCQGSPLAYRHRAGVRPDRQVTGTEAVEPHVSRLAARVGPPRWRPVHRQARHRREDRHARLGGRVRARLREGPEEGRDTAERPAIATPPRTGEGRPARTPTPAAAAAAAAATGNAMRVVMLGTGTFAEP